MAVLGVTQGGAINRHSLKDMWVWGGEPLLDGRWAVVLLLAAFLLALGLHWVGERGRRVTLPRPGWTFVRVSIRLGISPWDQWLLSRIAQAERLPTPLTLLVSSSTLRHHGRRYLKRLPVSEREGSARRIVRMERKIFGTRRYRAVGGGVVRKMAVGARE
ncbi:MAG: hypothetical protein IT442_13715 [Phycisphaeraceae bacterium]|nr:hypothetical protein [Phycisphaeraceae bacterium]